MGAAEFEFGALPKSLANIRDGINHYTYTVFTLNSYIGSKRITVFHPTSMVNRDILIYLMELANNKMRLHERSDFNTYLCPSKYDLEWQAKRGHSTDFWWDIDNDIIFWKSNEIFEDKFKSIISIKPE